MMMTISANTLTEDPDYPAFRISVLFGYIRIIRISGSGYPIITKLRVVYRPV